MIVSGATRGHERLGWVDAKRRTLEPAWLDGRKGPKREEEEFRHADWAGCRA